MKASIIAGSLLAALGIGAALIAAEGTQLKITSPVFQDGGKIPSKFTCDGTDASPQLHLDGAPPAAKSLARMRPVDCLPIGLFGISTRRRMRLVRAARQQAQSRERTTSANPDTEDLVRHQELTVIIFGFSRWIGCLT